MTWIGAGDEIRKPETSPPSDLNIHSGWETDRRLRIPTNAGMSLDTRPKSDALPSRTTTRYFEFCSAMAGLYSESLIFPSHVWRYPAVGNSYRSRSGAPLKVSGDGMATAGHISGGKCQAGESASTCSKPKESR